MHPALIVALAVIGLVVFILIVKSIFGKKEESNIASPSSGGTSGQSKHSNSYAKRTGSRIGGTGRTGVDSDDDIIDDVLDIAGEVGTALIVNELLSHDHDEDCHHERHVPEPEPEREAPTSYTPSSYESDSSSSYDSGDSGDCGGDDD